LAGGSSSSRSVRRSWVGSGLAGGEGDIVMEGASELRRIRLEIWEMGWRWGVGWKLAEVGPPDRRNRRRTGDSVRGYLVSRDHLLLEVLASVPRANLLSDGV
jgi:hypothetical protein